MATVSKTHRATAGSLSIKPLTPAIGAEILDIDLSAPNIDLLIPSIRSALLKYGVIFFRNQNLSQSQHIAFAKHFGELEIHPATPKNQENPEVLRITHGPKNRGSENNWHSDVTWREKPSMGSILLAREVPKCGGDTLFANMHLAYELLSEPMKAHCNNLVAVHDIARVFARRLGKSAEELHKRIPTNAPSRCPDSS